MAEIHFNDRHNNSRGITVVLTLACEASQTNNLYPLPAPPSQIGNISLHTFDVVRPRVTICTEPNSRLYFSACCKSHNLVWPQFRSNKHWFPCKFLIGHWAGGLDAKLREAKQRATKRIFPPRRQSWKLRRFLTHLPARLQRGRGRWEAGDVRYSAKSVGETEKQLRNRASIFFPKRALKSLWRGDRGHDRLGAESGVGTRNDPRLRHTTRRRWERRHQTLAKY